MARVRVDVDEVRALLRRMREINDIPFTDIEWVRGGRPMTLPLPPDDLKDWAFTGLSNTLFVELELDEDTSGRGSQCVPPTA